MKKRTLTPRQKMFVDEYLLDMNGSRAAISAGYSVRTADQQAHQLLKIPLVSEKIAEAIKKRSDELEIDSLWVLREAKRLYENCRESHPNVAARALELCGKHVSVQAFNDKKVDTAEPMFTCIERIIIDP